MSFTTTVYDAKTKEPLALNADPSALDTYSTSRCDLDGSLIMINRIGGAPKTAYCANGHRWIEVETLGADGLTRINEDGSWRQVQ